MGSSDHETARTTYILEPVDFYDESQCAELLRQRNICGWAKTPDYIDAWRTAMDARIKSMFWIKKKGPAAPEDDQDAVGSAIRIGHVSLDAESEPPNLELANPHDKSVMTISRLFILPEHRQGGAGRATMELLERYAREEPYGSPNCTAIAITTLSRRYYDEDFYRAEYALVNKGERSLDRGKSNEVWYERMGYVKWKDEPLYPEPIPGREDFKFVAAYMRKDIA